MVRKHWPQDLFQAKKDIDIPCEAWSSIPDAYGDEFIPLLRTEDGGTNLQLIRTYHWAYPIRILQFKEINYGKYEIVIEELENNTISFKCGNSCAISTLNIQSA